MSFLNGKKCKDCGAYRGTHSPLCPSITFKEAKHLLVLYYESWLALELERRMFTNDNRKVRKGATGWVFCPICKKRKSEA